MAASCCRVSRGHQQRRLPEGVERLRPTRPGPRAASSQARLCGALRGAHPQALAAAEHRGRQARGLRHHQDQQGARRGFLQGLQQGIGGEAVQGIGGDDDRHLVAPAVAGEGELGGQLAHLLDADLPASPPRGRGTPGPGARARARGGRRGSCPQGACRGARTAPAAPPTAPATRPPAPGASWISSACGRRCAAAGAARRAACSAPSQVGSGQGGHLRAHSWRASPAAARRPPMTCARAPAPPARLASITDTRCRLGVRHGEVAGAHALEEGDGLGLEAVRVRAAARARPRQALRSPAGPGAACSRASDPPAPPRRAVSISARVHPAPGTLVGAGGIGEAVTHHPGPARAVPGG